MHTILQHLLKKNFTRMRNFSYWQCANTLFLYTAFNMADIKKKLFQWVLFKWSHERVTLPLVIEQIKKVGPVIINFSPQVSKWNKFYRIPIIKVNNIYLFSFFNGYKAGQWGHNGVPLAQLGDILFQVHLLNLWVKR